MREFIAWWIEQMNEQRLAVLIPSVAIGGVAFAAWIVIGIEIGFETHGFFTFLWFVSPAFAALYIAWANRDRGEP